MKRALKKRAYREAAALLRSDMDAVELPDDLTEEEESEMREFIRREVADQLAAKGI